MPSSQRQQPSQRRSEEPRDWAPVTQAGPALLPSPPASGAHGPFLPSSLPAPALPLLHPSLCSLPGPPSSPFPPDRRRQTCHPRLAEGRAWPRQQLGRGNGYKWAPRCTGLSLPAAGLVDPGGHRPRERRPTCGRLTAHRW